jgi:hypothetical protein
MHVFGHDDIPGHIESVPPTNSFQGLFKERPRFRGVETWLSLVTTEREEVLTSRLLNASKTPRHAKEV